MDSFHERLPGEHLASCYILHIRVEGEGTTSNKTYTDKHEDNVVCVQAFSLFKISLGFKHLHTFCM